jgi:hypothetical protein
MQREYAETQAARREPVAVPERGVTILQTAFDARLKPAGRQAFQTTPPTITVIAVRKNVYAGLFRPK